MSIKLILNYMPPANIYTPSASLSILKGFMQSNLIETSIIYWNILIDNILTGEVSDYRSKDQRELDNLYLIPFIYMISEQYKDAVSSKKISAYLSSIFPRYQIKRDRYSLILMNLKKKIKDLIENRIGALSDEDIKLFGFSSKYCQWIPAMIVGEIIKKYYPDKKIVIGGFESKEKAKSLLSLCACFDYAIWGEGEYPLLELCNKIGTQTKNYNSVPRLVYRYDGKILETQSGGEYSDFTDYIYPDYSDFIDAIKGNMDIASADFPIEMSRGCHWNKCNFCTLNMGYKYRRRNPDSVIKEIECLYNKYGVRKFSFVDTDVVGNDIDRFENMLDRIIDLADKCNTMLELFGEIIHYKFNSRIIRKLAIAGFDHVQIGYEALCDSLLNKINKKVDFADHLLFVKYALKYGIFIAGANILRGVVGEDENDILESIENLVYLRFFINNHNYKFRHSLTKLSLQKGSRYFNMVSAEEKKRWNSNSLAYLSPEIMISENNRFDLLSFTSELKNGILWEYFEKINRYYENTYYYYNIQKHQDVYYYSEYNEAKLVNRIIFNKPEYCSVLHEANDEVTSLNKIYDNLKQKYVGIAEQQLIDVINNLRSVYLLYSNKDMTRIISIIHFSLNDCAEKC
jgi:radical SAM superfamily enzyme YgiQ (UPF0313 family)